MRKSLRLLSQEIDVSTASIRRTTNVLGFHSFTNKLLFPLHESKSSVTLEHKSHTISEENGKLYSLGF